MIERIIIENFKSICKLDLELKPINILIGANGAGKSNFIGFFKLTNRVYEHKLERHIGNNIDSFLRFGRKESDFIYGFFDFDNKYAVSYKIFPTVSKNTGYLDEENYLFNQANDLEKDYKRWKIVYQNIEIPENGLGLEELFDEASTKASSFSSIGGNSYFNSFKTYHFQDTGEKSPMKQANKISDNRYLRENGENLAAYLYYLQKKHPKNFKIIEANIRSVAPFFDRFDLAPDRSNENQIELSWLEKESDYFFNAYALSDGTLRFIALTTLLLQPDLPKTIIIDEPELGLHPFAINKLAAMIKQAAAKGSQVIVSTQSSDLVDNFEPEDVIAVDRKDEQSVFRRLNSEDYEEWLEDYTLGEIWSKNIVGAMP